MSMGQFIVFTIITISVFYNCGFCAQIKRDTESKRTCILPEYPNHGTWLIMNPNTNGKPGDRVPSGTAISVTCNEQYDLNGNSLIRCANSEKDSENNHCLRLCPNARGSAILKVRCTFQEKAPDCSRLTTWTTAVFQCTNSRGSRGLELYPTRSCTDGSWDLEIPKCVPIVVCGKKSTDTQILTINGTNVTRNDHPWQVAVYDNKKKQLLCGGTLISPRVILTAAHCVTNFDGNLLPKEDYIVAVGKFFRKYEDSRDKDAQYLKLKAMFVPEEFRGAVLNFYGDIAVLITEKDFQLSRAVLPVCVDWSLNYKTKFLEPKIEGQVTGWGYTVESDQPSEVLKEINVQNIEQHQCRQELPTEFTNKYLTSDKMCAGDPNKSAIACRGDAGGGLIHKNPHDGRYFITSVLSIAPRPKIGECPSDAYGLYTKVSTYIPTFISEKVNLYGQ